MFGLQSAWLNEAELQRLDGFHCRCLRKILKIPSAYYSRISNDRVLQEAGKPKARILLLQQQLILYGKLARLDSSSVLRKSLLLPGGVRPIHFNFRPRGRLRNNWYKQVFKHVQSVTAYDSQIWDENSWRRCVRNYVASI